MADYSRFDADFSTLVTTLHSRAVTRSSYAYTEHKTITYVNEGCRMKPPKHNVA